jgi:hypothetical protein
MAAQPPSTEPGQADGVGEGAATALRDTVIRRMLALGIVIEVRQWSPTHPRTHPATRRAWGRRCV